MNEQKYPTPGEALLVLLGIFVGLYILTEVFAAVISGLNMDQDRVQKQIRFFFLFGSMLFFIVPYLYSRFRNYDAKTLFRLNPVPSVTVLMSIIGGTSLSIIVDELDRLIAMLVPAPDWMLDLMQPLIVETPVDWVLAVAGVVLAAGFAEESLFRGFIQVALEQRGDVTKAVLLSAATWALIHIIPYWAIQIFLIGVVFGYLSWRTNSILPSVIMHAINNLIALFYVNFNTQDINQWYLRGDHVSPVLIVISAAVFYYSMKQIITTHPS